jgi:hypothetical protein
MIATVSILMAMLGTAPAGGTSPCELLRCTCVEVPSPQVALTAADAVFLGSVTAVRETTLQLDGADSGIPAREVSFRLHAAWKGIGAAEGMVTVTTGHGDGDCGFSFRAGVTYLVYARRSDGGALSTSICSRTAAASAARVDFDAIGHPPLVRHQ